MTGSVIATAGSLRLEWRTAPMAAICLGAVELLVLRVVPAFREDEPLVPAMLALKALRPCAPTLAYSETTAGRTRGGMYLTESDSIIIVNRGRMSDAQLAEVILHEVGHASGSPRPRRLARYGIGEPAGTAPAGGATGLRSFDDADGRQEEVTSDLCAAIVAVRLGIAPRFNCHPAKWIPRMGSLSKPRILAAVRDGVLAADYVLGRTQPPSTMTNLRIRHSKRGYTVQATMPALSRARNGNDALIDLSSRDDLPCSDVEVSGPFLTRDAAQAALDKLKAKQRALST